MSDHPIREYPVGRCTDPWCEYPEPHRHGFDCDRQCECFGVGPETVPLPEGTSVTCGWGDCLRPAEAGRIERRTRRTLPVCRWHAGWEEQR